MNRIDEIREFRDCGLNNCFECSTRRTLLAEVDRLTEDNERLTGISNNSDMPKYLDAVARMHAAEARAVVAEQAIQRVENALDELRRQESISMWAQGESPRPPDYSEGHYTGCRKGRVDAINAVAAALAGEEEA